MTTPGIGETAERVRKTGEIVARYFRNSGDPDVADAYIKDIDRLLAELARLEGEVERQEIELRRLTEEFSPGLRAVLVTRQRYDALKAAEALLAREGWVWAPCDPSEDMLSVEVIRDDGGKTYDFSEAGVLKRARRDIYRAMISVAGGEGKT